MSTDSSATADRPVGATITLTREENWWVAKDEETGVVSQGKTRLKALENLDEAIAGYQGDGEPPSEATLEAFGIEQDANTVGSIDESDIFE